MSPRDGHAAMKRIAAAGWAAAGLIALIRRWKSLPAIVSGGRGARWVQFGLSAAISVGLFGLLL